MISRATSRHERLEAAIGRILLARRELRLAVALAVAVSGFALVQSLCARLGMAIYLPESFDSWFDADTVRVFDDISQPTTWLMRAVYHPLFGLFAQALFRAMAAVRHASTISTVQGVLGLVGAGLLVAFVRLARAFDCGWLDAILFGTLLASSASFLYFAPIPETFSMGGATTLVALAWLVRSGDDWRGDLSSAGAIVSALSATTTNAAGPLAFLVATRRWSSIARVAAFSAALLVTLTIVEGRMLPNAGSRIRSTVSSLASADGHRDDGAARRGLRDLIPRVTLVRIGDAIRAFFVHSMVMPGSAVTPRSAMATRDRGASFLPSSLPLFSIQESAVGSACRWGLVAAAGWLALLGLGMWVSWRRIGEWKVRLVLTSLLVQLVLHAFVGRETFLYSLHFLPLLVLLAALGSTGPAREVVRSWRCSPSWRWPSTTVPHSFAMQPR